VNCKRQVDKIEPLLETVQQFPQIPFVRIHTIFNLACQCSCCINNKQQSQHTVHQRWCSNYWGKPTCMFYCIYRGLLTWHLTTFYTNFSEIHFKYTIQRSEMSQSYTPWSSQHGSESPYVEVAVNVRRYASYRVACQKQWRFKVTSVRTIHKRKSNASMKYGISFWKTLEVKLVKLQLNKEQNLPAKLNDNVLPGRWINERMNNLYSTLNIKSLMR